ncbi:MAG: hypothetical protein N3F03_02925 [Ignavibacteria bacterium]|nr:hypothetical protein [Ignavibacteria bacterium]
MAENLIVTILGRATGYSEINYKYNDFTGKEFLLSRFFKEYLSDAYTHQMIFLPHTLYTLKEEVVTILLRHENYSINLIPSLVADRKDEFKFFNFNANYGYISYLLFLYLVKFYLENPSLKNLYVDISVGLNIYIDALKEAARGFKVFADLLKLTRNDKINLQLLFSDPVIAADSSDKNVYVEKINVKVWFDTPITKDKLTENELSSINLDLKQKNLLKEFYYTFFSIYRNAPLVITTFGYKRKNIILNELKRFINEELSRFEINEETVKNSCYNIPSNFKLRQAVVLALALYYNISDELERSKINNTARGMVSINEIENFKDIYEKYGLNANKELLERDLRKLKDNANKLYEGSIKRIAEIENRNPSRNIDERNFYAHSGFEANITCLSKNLNEIRIGYDSVFRDKLKNLIFTQ